MLHRRQGRSFKAKDKLEAQSERFNLSSFLSILDGHTLEEGIIFIMTTNHPELLDPAIIRPGIFPWMPRKFRLTNKLTVYTNSRSHGYTARIDICNPLSNATNVSNGYGER